MNKVYRTVWNEHTNTWVAVQETAKARGKSSKSGGSVVSELGLGGSRFAMTAAASAVLMMSAPVSAAVYTDGVGTGSIIFHTGGSSTTTADGKDSVAIGTNAQVVAPAAVDKNTAVQSSIAVGSGAKVEAQGADGKAQNAIAFGTSALSTKNNAIAIGNGSKAQEQSALAVGDGANASASQSTAVGVATAASAAGASAFGHASKALADHGLAVGSGATAAAGATRAIAIGRLANAAAIDSLAMGNTASTNTINTIAIGNAAKVNGQTPLSGSATLHGVSGIAIGNKSEVQNRNYGIAIGDSAFVGTYANTKPVTNGAAPRVDPNREDKSDDAGRPGVAIGWKTQSTGDDSIALGNDSISTGRSAVALGKAAYAEDTDAIAIGNSARAGQKVGTKGGNSNHNSTAIGSYAHAVNGWNTALGTRSYADASGALAVGTMASAEGQRATAVGSYSFAEGLTSTALGYHTIATKNALAGTALGTGTVVDGKESGAWAAAPHGNPASFVAANRSYVGGTGNYAIGNRNVVGDKTTNSVAFGNNIKLGATGAALNSTSPGGEGNSIAPREESVTYTESRELDSAVAVGNEASVTRDRGIAVGQQAQAAGVDGGAIAIGSVYDGPNKREPGTPNVTERTKAWSNNSIAIGTGAEAGLDKADDTNTAANKTGAIAIGTRALAYEVSAAALGENAGAFGINSVALGANSTAENVSGVAVGDKAHSKGDNTVAVGANASADGSSAVAVGDTASTHKTATQSMALGNLAATRDGAVKGVAIGYKAEAAAGIEGAVALGAHSVADRNRLAPNATASSTPVLANSQVYVLDIASTADKAAVAKTAENTRAAVSVGLTGTNETRQIINVAAGTEDSDAVNVAQLKAVANQITAAGGAGGGTHYYSVKRSDPQGSNYNNDGATAENALAAGVDTAASGLRSTAVGHKASAQASDTVVLGNEALADSKAESAVVIGSRAKVGDAPAGQTSKDAVAIGYLSHAKTASSIALGSNAKADDKSQATAIGYQSNAQGYQSIAFGSNSVAGTNAGASVVIGVGANSQTAKSVALGNGATVVPTGIQNPDGTGSRGSFSAIAIGDGASVAGEGSVAIGKSSQTTYINSTAVGNEAQAVGYNTSALGFQAVAKGTSSVAIGDKAEAGTVDATGKSLFNRGVAVGTATKATGETAVALGSNAQATAHRGTALGVRSEVTAGMGVALGGYSIADRGHGVAGADPLNAKEAGAAENVWTSTAGAVSVGGGLNPVNGDKVITRQIINVAAGSQDTDAVNVAQLKTVANHTKNVGDTIVNVLGGDAAITPQGNISMTNIGGTGKGNIHDAIEAATTKVASADKSVIVDHNTANNTYDLAVRTDDDTIVKDPATGALKVNMAAAPTVTRGNVTVAAGDEGKVMTAGDVAKAINDSERTSSVVAGSASLSVTAGAEDANGNTEYTVDLAQATKDDIQKGVDAKNIVDNQGLTFNGDNGSTSGVKKLGDSVAITGDSNITTVADGNGVQVTLNPNLNVTSVKAGDTLINNDGLTITGGPSVTKSGINAGNKVISGVANGVNPNDAVNVSQLEAAAAAAKTTVASADKSVAVTHDAANNAYDLSVNTDNTTIVKDPATGALKANTAAINTAPSGQAQVAPADAGKLATAGDIANAINNSGFTLTTQGEPTTASLVNPGETVDLSNDDGNIIITKGSGDNNVNFSLADTVKIGPAANPITINGTERTISGLVANLPVTTSTGTPTTEQTAPANPAIGNAATVGDVLNAGWNLQVGGAATDFVRPYDTVNFVGANGATVTPDTDGAKTTITIGMNAQAQAESAQLPVVYTDANGNKVYLVDDPANPGTKVFKPNPDGTGATVPAGDVIASMQNADGTTSNPTTLANVKAGVKNTDAVNVSQLKGAADALGGGAAINPDGSFKAPSYTITKTDGTSYPAANNVGDALKNLNDEVVKPITFGGDTGAAFDRTLGSTVNVKGGATGTLTEGNIGVEASNGTLNVKLAENIDLGNNGSVVMGDTKVDANGLAIIGGPSITKSDGINAGGKQITNVASGGDTDTNGANIGDVKRLAAAAAAAADTSASVSAGSTSVTVTKGATTNGVTDYAVDLSQAAKDSLAKADTAVQNVVGDSNITAQKNGDTVNLSLAPVVNIGPAQGGNPVTINGNAGTIGGLTNKAFDPTNFVSGQAATEDQLAQVATAAGKRNTVSAGSNIVVTPTTANGVTNYQVATNPNMTLTSVTTTDGAGNQTVTNGNGVTITPAAQGKAPVSLTGDGLNNGGNKITNVAEGTAGTDAVNVDQLNKAINNVNVTIPGQLQGRLNGIENRVNQVENTANAGVAQAIATAGLPQAYLPGKSMVAVGGGYYKGETGYAVGFSTISDGGNWIIKGTASGNSRGHFGASVGAGYQW